MHNVITVDTSATTRRAILNRARAGGPPNAVVAELMARFVADLAVDETGDLELGYDRGTDPRTDRELLAVIARSGPHGPPIARLILAHSAMVAMFDSYDRGETHELAVAGLQESANGL